MPRPRAGIPGSAPRPRPACTAPSACFLVQPAPATNSSLASGRMVCWPAEGDCDALHRGARGRQGRLDDLDVRRSRRRRRCRPRYAAALEQDDPRPLGPRQHALHALPVEPAGHRRHAVLQGDAVTWVSMRPPSRQATPGSARAQREVEGARTSAAPEALAQRFRRGGDRWHSAAGRRRRPGRPGCARPATATWSAAGCTWRPLAHQADGQMRRPAPVPPPELPAPAWPALPSASV